jgi:hypothetical protein
VTKPSQPINQPRRLNLIRRHQDDWLDVPRSAAYRFTHLDADPLRRASEVIGGQLAAALDGKRGASVVQLKGARQT